MKKLLAIICVMAMIFSLAACGSTAASTATTAPAATQAPAAEEPAHYVVGICQLLQHQALDAASQGFMDALTEKLGDAVEFDYQDASGDSAICSTICTTFVSNGYDLIMANATPALQAAVSATDTIPVLATSITDYATALGNADMDATVGTGINCSGTSDGVEPQVYVDLTLEVVPDAKNVSVLYCSAEANSVVQADGFVAAMAATAPDVVCTVYTFNDSNDMQSVVTTAIEGCDALYIPTDNTAASNMTIVANACEPAGIPVICGEENMMSVGGLCTASISYYDIGHVCGEMAYEILVNGADISTMPIGYASTPVKEYNPAFAEAIGIEMPEGFDAYTPAA